MINAIETIYVVMLVVRVGGTQSWVRWGMDMARKIKPGKFADLVRARRCALDGAKKSWDGLLVSSEVVRAEQALEALERLDIARAIKARKLAWANAAADESMVELALVRLDPRKGI